MRSAPWTEGAFGVYLRDNILDLLVSSAIISCVFWRKGDGKAVPILFDDDARFAVHLLHEVRHSEHSNERHGEARGVGRAEQFIGGWCPASHRNE